MKWEAAIFRRCTRVLATVATAATRPFIGAVFIGVLAIRPSIALAITVAVVPFDNGGPADMDGLSVGLQSMVTTDLSVAEDVTVVERARLQDLLAEMDLAKKGVLDPSTAVELGKVAGATHVVAGSFTVVGDTMRLDARLAEVATGHIAVAAEQSGERDAFFELEKALVKSLLAELGAELSPKERAAVGRLHTADFDQLKRFGEGIALYDAERYAEAIAVLEEVTRADADFKLAAVTLADVEQVRDAAEKKARAVRLANAEAAFVVHQQEAREEAEMVEKLQALASEKGDWKRRATANLVLAGALERTGVLKALPKAADRFALERLSERAFQAYWAEVRQKVPDYWPRFQDPEYRLRKGVDVEMEKSQGRWFAEGEGAERFERDALWSCEYAGLTIGEEEVERLWIPARRQLDARLEILQAAGGCEDTQRRHRALLDLAKEFAKLGDVGEALAILDQLTRESTDERFLGSVAYQAEQLAEQQERLKGLKRGSLEEELVRIGRQRRVPDTLAQLRSDVGYHVRRELPFQGPVFVGGTPVWPIPSRGARLVRTGRRTGIDETEALVYYRHPGVKLDRPPSSLFVIGGVPVSSGVVAVTVDFEPDPDFYPGERRRLLPEDKVSFRLSNARPLTGVLVGLREIETETVLDPGDPKSVEKATAVPTTGYGVLIRDGSLILARVQERPLDELEWPKYQRGLVVTEVLDETSLKVRGPVEIRATIDGTRLVGTAGGAEVSATLPEAPNGFVGWMADGEGHVGMSAPSLQP